MSDCIQIGDSYRDIAVVTRNGDTRHIMYVIAESQDELLVVPMDTYPEDENPSEPELKVYVKMAQEFELNPGDYSYKYIKHRSFINYKKAQIVSKHNVNVLISNYDIDVLDSISDEFLEKLIDVAMTSKFLKKDNKAFLIANPWC